MSVDQVELLRARVKNVHRNAFTGWAVAACLFAALVFDYLAEHTWGWAAFDTIGFVAAVFLSIQHWKASR